MVERRTARVELREARDGLDKAVAEERLLELEIELIGQRELTLPPHTYPWDRFDWRHEVWRRAQDLNWVRVEGTGRNYGGGCAGSSPWAVDEVTRRWWWTLEQAIWKSGTELLVWH